MRMSGDVDTVGSTQGTGLRAWIRYHWILAILIALAVLLVLWLIISAVLKPKKKVGPPPPIPV